MTGSDRICALIRATLGSSQRTVRGKLRMEFIVWATNFLAPTAASPAAELRDAVGAYPSVGQAWAAAQRMAAQLGPSRYDSERGCWFVESPCERLVVISLESLGMAAEAA